jgi:hypothetical protein
MGRSAKFKKRISKKYKSSAVSEPKTVETDGNPKIIQEKKPLPKNTKVNPKTKEKARKRLLKVMKKQMKYNKNFIIYFNFINL